MFQTGEGGIILLPGASLDESFTDDGDEDWLKSLEGPPSPCDVTFINDNVVIDGRSSMNQKSRMRQKVRKVHGDSVVVNRYVDRTLECNAQNHFLYRVWILFMLCLFHFFSTLKTNLVNLSVSDQIFLYLLICLLRLSIFYTD